jgi:hypothetical protein
MEKGFVSLRSTGAIMNAAGTVSFAIGEQWGE